VHAIAAGKGNAWRTWFFNKIFISQYLDFQGCTVSAALIRQMSKVEEMSDYHCERYERI
jgi:hypothetical protein